MASNLLIITDEEMKLADLWFTVKFFRKPTFADQFIRKWDSSKQRLNGTLLGLLDTLKVMTSYDATRSSAWNLEPKVYDAYISGLVFKTALLYSAPNSKEIAYPIKKLYQLIDARVNQPSFNITAVGPRNIDDLIVSLYVEISLKFLSLIGFSTDSSLTSLAEYLLSHPDQFQGQTSTGVLANSDSPSNIDPVLSPLISVKATQLTQERSLIPSSKIEVTDVRTGRKVKRLINRFVFYDPSTSNIKVRENTKSNTD